MSDQAKDERALDEAATAEAQAEKIEGSIEGDYEALVRLLKPLSYYQEKYGTPLWGFTKLFLLMEKQHNRGQDGAGGDGQCMFPVDLHPNASWAQNEYLTVNAAKSRSWIWLYCLAPLNEV